jgi:hypothetical protein
MRTQSNLAGTPCTARAVHTGGCTALGSVVLAADAMRPVPSRAAAEGTVAHSIAAEALISGVNADAYLGRVFETDGFTFKVDQDMAEHVQTYLDNAREYAAGDVPLVEVEVDYSRPLGLAPGQGFGTTDLGVVRADEIGVHDLKFGRGENVDVEDNDQLLLYALGLLEQYGDLMAYGPDTKVVMAIHQPRVQKTPKESTTTVAAIRAFGDKAKLAVHAVKAAIWGYAAWKNDGRQAKDWERFEQQYLNLAKNMPVVPAKAGCSAVRNVVARTVMAATPVTPDEFQAITLDPKPHVAVADNAWLAASLAQAPMIEGWLKALYAERDLRLQAGQRIEGFKLVLGPKGDRKWADEVAVEHLFKTGMKLSETDMYSRKLIAPPAAEKLTKGVAPAISKTQWEKLQEMIVRADGKPVAAPDSDPRPALSVTPVDDEFDDVTPAPECDIG